MSAPKTKLSRIKFPLRPFVPSLEVLEDRLAPAHFVVNSPADTVAVNLVTGEDADGFVTLRSALIAANHLGGSNSIFLPSGVYDLSLEGVVEDEALTGDLDIKNHLTILGDEQGLTPTTINANEMDRVFEVFSGYTVTLQGLNVIGGKVGTALSGPADGGAVYNRGTLNVVRSSVSGKAIGLEGSPGLAARGGAFYNGIGASLTLVESTVFGQAFGGSGRPGTPGEDAINFPTIGENAEAGGAARGGAIYNAGGIVTIMGGRVSGLAQGGNGGIGGAGGSGEDNTNTFGARGGNGGDGGVAEGGTIYQVSGTVTLLDGPLNNFAALDGLARGGDGGAGGQGGNGGWAATGSSLPGGYGAPGGDGGSGGTGRGGVLFIAAGNLTMSRNGPSLLGSDLRGAAWGGAGGIGGHGGSGGNGATATLYGTAAGHGGIGREGGNGGDGGDAFGGIVFFAGSTLSVRNSSWGGDAGTAGYALGGRAGAGGFGGYGGSGGSGLGDGAGNSGGAGMPGGVGGHAGAGGDAFGGLLYAASGSTTFEASTLSGSAYGGDGERGGDGGGTGGGGTGGDGLFQGGPGGPLSGPTAKGGDGGAGGHAYAGGIFVLSANVSLVNSLLYESHAIAGKGMDGGTGGAGGRGGDSGWGGQLSGIAWAGSVGGLGGDGGTGGSATGGGLVNAGGTVQLNNSTFVGNTVRGGDGGDGGWGGPGGGGGNEGAGVVGGNSLGISTIPGAGGNGGSGGQGGNSGSSQGGAIAVSAGVLTISSSTIANNQAAPGIAGGGGQGGSGGYGGYVRSGARYEEGDGLPGNSGEMGATGAALGGGVSQSGGSVSIRTTILAANLADTDFDYRGVVFDLGFNLIGGNPLLGPLGDNGGPTWTRALLPGSPALNAGAADTTMDQRGAPRDGAPDIGAFELDETPPTVEGISPSGANPTRTSLLPFTLTFSETVLNLDLTDLELTANGGIADASIISISPVNGRTFTVMVDRGTGEGTLRLRVKADADVNDIAGNPLPLTGFTSVQGYVIDTSPPQISHQIIGTPFEDGYQGLTRVLLNTQDLVGPVTIHYSVNGGSIQQAPGAMQLPFVRPGSYRVDYFARDAAGNETTLGTAQFKLYPTKYAPTIAAPAVPSISMFRNGTLQLPRVTVTDRDTPLLKLNVEAIDAATGRPIGSVVLGRSFDFASGATVDALNSALTGMTFRPAAGFVGTAKIRITVKEAGSESNPMTAQSELTVLVVNRPPIENPSPPSAFSSVISARVNRSLVVPASRLLPGFVDPDGDLLSLILDAPPSIGTWRSNPNGTYTYTPPRNYRGPVTFSVKAYDGISASVPKTFTIDVR